MTFMVHLVMNTPKQKANDMPPPCKMTPPIRDLMFLHGVEGFARSDGRHTAM
jgi:hypothetical protein